MSIPPVRNAQPLVPVAINPLAPRRRPGVCRPRLCQKECRPMGQPRMSPLCRKSALRSLVPIGERLP